MVNYSHLSLSRPIFEARMSDKRSFLVVAFVFSVASIPAAQEPQATKTASEAQAAPIDRERARVLFQKRQRGEKLTADEETYLRRAMEERKRRARPAGQRPPGPFTPREKTGLTPLNEMSAEDRYQDQDGGLYGQGRNAPPDEHLRAAREQAAKIEPLDAEGKPDEDGRIVFASISMSNATQEFSTFKRIADSDPTKSPKLTIVDCAQGGQAMAEWAPPQAAPWQEAERRLKAAGVTPQQVQIAWIKLANKQPSGDLHEHGKKLQRDTLAVIQNAKARFPNLRIAYLGSRIYAGYASGALNPEPYAYESAFVARWLIQDQIKGDPELSYNGDPRDAKVPLLLWGPYFWGDGVTPRKVDMLVWNREDFAADGVHPLPSGREKVARMLLDFFKSDETATPWFVRAAR
jgi:hypothetical protein